METGKILGIAAVVAIGGYLIYDHYATAAAPAPSIAPPPSKPPIIPVVGTGATNTKPLKIVSATYGPIASLLNSTTFSNANIYPPYPMSEDEFASYINNFVAQNTLDVTSQVRGLISSNSIYANSTPGSMNNLFGLKDLGVPKQLIVNYTIGNDSYQTTFHEDQPININSQVS